MPRREVAAADLPRGQASTPYARIGRKRVRVAAAADGVATLAATIKRKRGAQSLAKSVSFSDDVVTP